jgi:hypothetical protein
VGIAATAALSFAAVWLKRRADAANASKVYAWAGVGLDFAQTVVAHLNAEMRPALAQAFKDGRLSEIEKKEIKAKALEILRKAMGPALAKMGMPGEVLEATLSGWLERAVAAESASKLGAAATAAALTAGAEPTLSPTVIAPGTVGP